MTALVRQAGPVLEIVPDDTPLPGPDGQQPTIRRDRDTLDPASTELVFSVVVQDRFPNPDPVVRSFPGLGIPEDPVTGSIHCALTPYWSSVFNKNTLSAKQLSKRGGEIQCELLDDRVKLKGEVQLYMIGEVYLPS